MAKNLKYGDVKGLAVVCSDPATPASGDPVRYGEMTGVALADEYADGETPVDFTPGNVWELSVKGIDGSGNSAVAAGDKLYYVDADTPKISKKATGRFFGFAKGTVTSGATATIEIVKVLA
jgi:predicted RecA/RadA family phage recombinase